MKTRDFFIEVYKGEFSELDMIKHIEFITDDYEEEKLIALKNDLEKYVDNAEYFRRKSITAEEIKNKIDLYKKNRWEIPVFTKIYDSQKEVWRDREGAEVFDKNSEEYDKILPEIIDLEQVFYPTEFVELYNLQGIIHEIIFKRTGSYYVKPKFEIEEQKEIKSRSFGEGLKYEEPYDFFWEIHEGYVSDFAVYKRVQELTEGFNPTKIQLLCQEFDFYFFYVLDEWECKFTQEEVDKKIEELESKGETIPLLGDDKLGSLGVNYFFKSKRVLKRKELTQEEKEEHEKRLKDMFSNISKRVCIRKLMDPYALVFGSAYKLRNLLVELKIKYTDSELKPQFEEYFKVSDSISKEKSVDLIPIHWLKSNESLRAFINELKTKEIIEDRETDDIIQEHFKVDGKVPTKEPKPIKWLIDIRYLAYLIYILEGNIISLKGNKHKVTIMHFVNATDKELSTGSLATSLSKIKDMKADDVIYFLNSLVSKIKD